MDEHADDGGVDGHEFFVGEVEAVQVRVEAGGAVDDGFVGFRGDGGGEFAEARVGPDSGEVLEGGAVVCVGVWGGWVDGVRGVWANLHGREEEGIGDHFLHLFGWVVVHEPEAGGESAAAGAGGLELVDGGDHVHDTAVPDIADEFGGGVGEEVGGGRLETYFRDDDGAGFLCGFVEFDDDFLDPGSFAGGIDIVSTIFRASLDNRCGIKVIWSNSVDDNTGLLGERLEFRGGELGGDHRRRRAS